MRQRIRQAGFVVLAIGAGVAVLVGYAYSAAHPPPGKELAITRTEDDRLEVWYKPCRKLAFSAVRLIEVNGQVFGDKNDTTIWEGRASPPILPLDPIRLSIGEPSSIFPEADEYRPPSKDQLALLLLESDGDTTGRAFRLSDLKSGEYLDAWGHYMSEEEFLRSDNCRNR